MAHHDIIMSAAAGGAAPVYIEDVFSTYLYTGNGTSQSIVNGVDLAGKGGLTWIKRRDGAADHYLFDTVRGVDKALQSDTQAAQLTVTGNGVNPFNNNGFTVNGSLNRINQSASTYASWTFRKQPKFFDVVTYTGNSTGTQTQNVAHNLGSVPGCIMVKRVTGAASDWYVYHVSNGPTYDMFLNATSARLGGSVAWNSTSPTSTVFTVGTDSNVNSSGDTFVALVFAHNAGGFGLTGTDNVISCGSFTQVSAGVDVNLGYEPQWILYKDIGSGGYDWQIVDNMRGFTTSTADQQLQPNTSAAESSNNVVGPTATGFRFDLRAGTYIYIAIRRGPMKVPTDATTVFKPVTSASATGTTQTTNFPVDMQIWQRRGGGDPQVLDRLRGVSTTTTEGGQLLYTDSTGAEFSGGAARNWDSTGFQTHSSNSFQSVIYWCLRRAPSFFDEVCYTGTGSATTFSHNLGVAPELMIFKNRTSSGSWTVYAAPLGATKALILETTNASATTSNFNNTAPTSSVFSVGGFSGTNASGQNYVAYLFATCPGVSKVGSYTGTAAAQTINCGFAAGARFVLIKRTDSASDWYYWDTARGITSGNDPYLLLNSAAAETTTTDYISPQSSGFGLTASAPADLNASGGTYIFLAIA